MPKFLITDLYGYQRVEECEYYDLYLKEHDICIVKIADESIKIEEEQYG